MVLLSSTEIETRLDEGSLAITPLDRTLIGPGSISLRLGREAFRLQALRPVLVDDPATYPCIEPIELDANGRFVVSRGEVILAPTLERISMPSDLAGWLSGTSDLARLGVQVVLSQFVSPGFASAHPGVLVLEILSHVSDIHLIPEMRVAHLALLGASSAPAIDYDALKSGYSGADTVRPSELFRRLKSIE